MSEEINDLKQVFATGKRPTGEDFSKLIDGLKPEVTANDIEQISTQLADTARGLNYYWIPPQQPPARKDHAGWFTDAFAHKFQDYIDNLFEPLRTANPDYITRVSLGKDQSGQYDVWKYTLAPKNYEKTIIISSSLHGSEVTLTVTMARFLHYLINENDKHPELSYIREKVRIIFVPFANPWGTSQTPRTRYNSRGVDLNRNFDYKWNDYLGAAAFGHDYKGTSPFSEAESRYMRDLLNAHPEAIAFLDLHNTGTPISFDYYVSMAENYEYSTYEQLAAYFTKNITSAVVKLDRNTNPSLSNFIYNVKGIPSAHPEWCDARQSRIQYSSEEITLALTWLSNVIIEHCREFTPQINPKTINAENIVANSSFSLNTNGWITGGLSSLKISNNAFNAVSAVSIPTPHYRGDLTQASFKVGDKIFARIKAKCPSKCTSVRFTLRDMTDNITGNIATVNSPVADTYIELSGMYEFTQNSSAPKLQIQFIFSSIEDTADQAFSIAEPLVFHLTRDFGDSIRNKPDLDEVFSQTGKWFEGTKTVHFIENLNSLSKSQKDITRYLIDRLRQIELRIDD